MKKTVIFLVMLTASGCKAPAEIKPESSYDLAIEKLSITSQQLDSISKEKDLYVKVLEDFEKQKTEYGYLLNSQQILDEMLYLSDWHYDIARREKEISFQHALNVYEAHTLAARKHPDPNELIFASPASGKP